MCVIASVSDNFNTITPTATVKVLNVNRFTKKSNGDDEGSIETLYCDGHLRSCRVGLGGVGGVRGSTGNGRLAGSRRIRVGIWNVGPLTRKFFELVDVLGIHKVDIACFQETKWKGSSTKEGNGYKLWSSNRIMAVTLVIDGETVNELQWMDIHGFMNVLLTELGIMKEETLEYARTAGYTRARVTVSKGLSARVEDLIVCDADQMWNTLACTIRDITKDSLAVKHVRFRELLLSQEGQQADRAIAEERYKVAKREAKKEVAHVKGKVYEDLHKKLDSKEGTNDIYKIAKAHERKRKDLGSIRYIKDESGQSIVDEEGTRWGDYFFDLFNERRPEGRGRSDEGLKWLTCLFNKNFSSAKMPNEWRVSEVIPIYKNKGDAQVCSNNIGIKLLNHTMKLWERVIERRLRKETRVLENQLGFMPGRSTTKGSKCWPTTKAQGNRVKVAELRILRWTCCKTMLDMIPDWVFRVELEVKSIISKMREGRLRWFGHVRRRSQSAPVMRVEALVANGLRRRGRPKLRWEDRLKQDMNEILLSEDMILDRNAWRDRISIGG
nr:hypothetical protein [Tanacetum cinerariifolium]